MHKDLTPSQWFFSKATHNEGVYTQSSFDQGEQRVLHQRDDGAYGHQQTVQLPKVTGRKTERAASCSQVDKRNRIKVQKLMMNGQQHHSHCCVDKN